MWERDCTYFWTALPPAYNYDILKAGRFGSFVAGQKNMKRSISIKEYVYYDKNIRMSKKLTLSMDEKVIEKAKLFAKRSNRSLSELIESYLKKITDQSMDDADIELLNIKGLISLDKDFDEKKEIRDILVKKHQA